MADVLRATYADLKTVKTRSTCQLILELPIEALTDVVALLGAPIPGNEVWVAVARLMTPQQLEEAIEAIPASDPEPDNMIEPPANDDRAPRPLSQVSAILCGIVAFRRYLFEAFNLGAIPTKDEAADIVREKCGVRSRSELDTDEAAASNFRHLRNGYQAWMAVA
jgi:hypothetical protein